MSSTPTPAAEREAICKACKHLQGGQLRRTCGARAPGLVAVDIKLKWERPEARCPKEKWNTVTPVEA
jgi:hypothetical protein